MNRYYWHWNGAAVSIKVESFFIEQGGLIAEWGRHWTLIEADSIEDARTRAKHIVNIINDAGRTMTRRATLSD